MVPRPRVVDHNAFQWTDTAWQGPPLAGAIIYEIHVGTFTPAGTFDAAIERLPHLAALGIAHIELMPIAAFPGKFGWGYDGVALFAVRNTYGGPDALRRLVNACHMHGIGVFLDVVYNHFGPVGNYANKSSVPTSPTPAPHSVGRRGEHQKATEATRSAASSATTP